MTTANIPDSDSSRPESVSYHDFMMTVLKSKKLDDIRYGQHAFNMLDSARPDLAHRVAGTDIDPFYVDNNLYRFWLWLEENWNKTDED